MSSKPGFIATPALATEVRQALSGRPGADARASLLASGSQQLCQAMARMIADALAAIGKASERPAVQSDADDAGLDMRGAAALLRENRPAVEAHFAHEFSALLQQSLSRTAGGASPQGSGEHELALVDDAFIRDKLRLEKLVQRTRSALQAEEVLGMRARLGELARRDWFDEATFPGSPGALYESLQRSIDKVERNAGAKWALLTLLEPYVSANLNAVYARINSYWRAAGVLPAIKPQVLVSQDTGRQTGAQNHEQPVTRAKAAPGGAAGTVGRNEETFLLPAQGPEREAILAALARDVAAGGHKARQSAVRMLAEPENFGVADLPMPEIGLIDALDRMQSGARDGAVPAQALAELTGQTRAQGSPLDQLTVEIVALIFEYLQDDPRIPDAVKAELVRLQIVAVKAALLDRSFFASRHHPMRRLIDAVSDIAGDPQIDSSPSSPFVAGLAEVVDTVLREFDRDLAVFEQAVHKVEELEVVEVARHAASVIALAESGARREREGQLVDQALRELEARMDEMTPEFARVFLTDIWTGVMVVARLAEEAGVPGTPGDARAPDTVSRWAWHLQIAEQMLWSVAPRQVDELKRLSTMLPGMIKGLTSAVQSHPSLAGPFEDFMKELMRWHTHSIASAKRAEQAALRNVLKRPLADEPTSPVLALDGRGAVRFSGVVPEHREPEPLPGAGDDLIAGLARGQRFEYRRPDRPPLRCKLAWISPARKLFALARFPDFAHSFDRAAMAGLLQRGELVAVAEQPVLERAMGALATDPVDAGPDASQAARPGMANNRGNEAFSLANVV